MASQLLEKTSLAARQQNLLQTLKVNTDRLLTLIDDVLSLSKLEAQELQLESRSFDLRKTFQALSELFAAQVQTKGLRLAFEIADDVPTMLVGDDQRLQQVFSNLIGNAIKFTDTGGITVAAALETSSSTPAADRVSLHFTVRDTGIGVDAAKQNDLFQPFIQADTSVTRRFGGTGLGLTICRRIVQVMGGDIGLDSTPGQGSTFWFQVPLAVSEDAAPDSTSDRSATPTAAAPSSQPTSTLSVLLVEDYDDNRELMLMILENLGYQADAVTNGQEFLDRTAEQAYDIVLLDCQMPVLDGYEAVRRLRQREGQQRHTTVIGMTAHAMPEDREKCLAAGMDDYLSKPVAEDALVEMLQRWG